MRSLNRSGTRRSGNVLAIVSVLLVFMLGMVAFTVDIGQVASTRTQLQRTADAAALAGASLLAHAPGGSVSPDDVRAEVRSYAALNGGITVLDSDIVLFRYDPTATAGSQISTDLSDIEPNAVQVTVRRDATANQPLSLFFAPSIGVATADVHATATAFLEQAYGLTGGNSALIPFTVPRENYLQAIGEESQSEDSTDDSDTTDDKTKKGGGKKTAHAVPQIDPNQLLRELILLAPPTSNGGGNSGGGNSGGGNQNSLPVIQDQLSIAANGSIQSVPDGINELLLYSSDSTAPGNYGSIDLGSLSNGTPDLNSQLLNGPTAADLQLMDSIQTDLGSPDVVVDGAIYAPFTTTGDPGISGGIENTFQSIVGMKRIIPLHDGTVSESGNNAEYNIIEFAAVTIMQINLRGNPKTIWVQPTGLVSSKARGSRGNLPEGAVPIRGVFTTPRLIVP